MRAGNSSRSSNGNAQHGAPVPGWIDPPPKLKELLKEHQREGVQFCKTQLIGDGGAGGSTTSATPRRSRYGEDYRGVILAHSMGLGKTLTALTYMSCRYIGTLRSNPFAEINNAAGAGEGVSNSRRRLHCLLLVPKSTVGHWVQECKDWVQSELFKPCLATELPTVFSLFSPSETNVVPLHPDIGTTKKAQEEFKQQQILDNFESQGGFLVMGYEEFVSVLGKKVEVAKEEEKQRQVELQAQQKPLVVTPAVSVTPQQATPAEAVTTSPTLPPMTKAPPLPPIPTIGKKTSRKAKSTSPTSQFPAPPPPAARGPISASAGTTSVPSTVSTPRNTVHQVTTYEDAQKHRASLHLDDDQTMVFHRDAEMQLARKGERLKVNLKGGKNTGGTSFTTAAAARQQTELRNRGNEKILPSFVSCLDVVMFDEAHRCKDNRTKSVQQLQYWLSHVRERIALTGTPLQNHLREYATMIQLVKPEGSVDPKVFEATYAKPIARGQCIDATPEERLHTQEMVGKLQELVRPTVHRRGVKLLEQHLPPRFELVVVVELSRSQQLLYSRLISWVKEEVGIMPHQHQQQHSGANVLVLRHLMGRFLAHPSLTVASGKLPSFRKAAANGGASGRGKRNRSPGAKGTGRMQDQILEADDDGEESLSDDDEEEDDASPVGVTSALRTIFDSLLQKQPDLRPLLQRPTGAKDPKLAAASSKLAVCLSIIDGALQRGEKIVVFSLYIPTLRLLAELLGGSGPKGSVFLLTGQTSLPDRADMIRQFNTPANTSKNVFLASTKAGGVGVNLVAANHCIMLDHHWNPTEDSQATFRIFRYGQQRPCFIYRLVNDRTVEDVVFQYGLKKEWLAKKVVDLDDPVRVTESDNASMWRSIFESNLAKVRGVSTVLRGSSTPASNGSTGLGSLPSRNELQSSCNSVMPVFSNASTSTAGVDLPRSIVDIIPHSFLLRDDIDHAKTIQKAKELQEHEAEAQKRIRARQDELRSQARQTEEAAMMAHGGIEPVSNVDTAALDAPANEVKLPASPLDLGRGGVKDFVGRLKYLLLLASNPLLDGTNPPLRRHRDGAFLTPQGESISFATGTEKALTQKMAKEHAIPGVKSLLDAFGCKTFLDFFAATLKRGCQAFTAAKRPGISSAHTDLLLHLIREACSLKSRSMSLEEHVLKRPMDLSQSLTDHIARLKPSSVTRSDYVRLSTDLGWTLNPLCELTILGFKELLEGMLAGTVVGLCSAWKAKGHAATVGTTGATWWDTCVIPLLPPAGELDKMALKNQSIVALGAAFSACLSDGTANCPDLLPHGPRDYVDPIFVSLMAPSPNKTTTSTGQRVATQEAGSRVPQEEHHSLTYQSLLRSLKLVQVKSINLQAADRNGMLAFGCPRCHQGHVKLPQDLELPALALLPEMLMQHVVQVTRQSEGGPQSSFAEMQYLKLAVSIVGRHPNRHILAAQGCQGKSACGWNLRDAARTTHHSYCALKVAVNVLLLSRHLFCQSPFIITAKGSLLEHILGVGTFVTPALPRNLRESASSSLLKEDQSSTAPIETGFDLSQLKFALDCCTLDERQDIFNTLLRAIKMCVHPNPVENKLFHDGVDTFMENLTPALLDDVCRQSGLGTSSISSEADSQSASQRQPALFKQLLRDPGWVAAKLMPNVRKKIAVRLWLPLNGQSLVEANLHERILVTEINTTKPTFTQDLLRLGFQAAQRAEASILFQVKRKEEQQHMRYQQQLNGDPVQEGEDSSVFSMRPRHELTSLCWFAFLRELDNTAVTSNLAHEIQMKEQKRRLFDNKEGDEVDAKLRARIEREVGMARHSVIETGLKYSDLRAGEAAAQYPTQMVHHLLL